MEATDPNIQPAPMNKPTLEHHSTSEKNFSKRLGFGVISILILQLGMQAMADRRISKLQDALVHELVETQKTLHGIKSETESLNSRLEQVNSNVSTISRASIFSLQTVRMSGSSYQTLPVASINWSGR